MGKVKIELEERFFPHTSLREAKERCSQKMARLLSSILEGEHLDNYLDAVNYELQKSTVYEHLENGGAILGFSVLAKISVEI